MQLIYAGSARPTSLANSSPDMRIRMLRSITATDGGACQCSSDKTERDPAVRWELVLQAVSATRRMRTDILMVCSKQPNENAQRCATESSGL